ncbi:family 78 glycoside hydrolase catalytic domain [Nocardioides sp.]|uniref:family 78 glycoside hydrolase catalytic domain n=1 Tax=Nocardioides sp. TaxID=35761 RepID=UPI0039E380DF
MPDATVPPRPHQLRAGHRRAPLGLPVRATQLSWQGPSPTGSGRYTVSVRAESGERVWEESTARHWARLPREVLRSRGGYRWTVTGEGLGTAESGFELGLADEEEWQARWIQAPRFPFARESHDPVPVLRTTFEAPESTRGRTRLYISALGLYRVWLNGVELTADELLRPGWTDYSVRVHHQTYDCAGPLVAGRNVLVVELAKGWYAGRLGLLRAPGYYGQRPALLAQVDQVGEDGSASTLCHTDTHWRTTFGPILASDLMRGETVDLRQRIEGLHTTELDDSDWRPVEPRQGEPVHVTPQPHDSIRVLRELPGELVHEHARGPVVFDFGQNLVGWTRVSSPMLERTEVIVRHGEILTPEKLVYRDNLRGAFQEDRYAADTPPGDETVQVLESSFTTHGFRYAEVWGLPGADPYGATRLRQDSTITAVAIETGHDLVGRFSASDERLTRLASAIEWTVRDNFLEVATDCPQRDERHGWLGDAGVISRTATYLFDTAAFFDKFGQDAADTQGEDGEIRSYVPPVPPGADRPGAPGWSDGYVRIVHLLVEQYGDLTTAERHVGAITRFAEHVLRHNPDGLRVNQVGADFADWLSLPERDGETFHPGYAYTGAYSTAPKPVVGTAHTYRTFVQLAQILARLGEDTQAARWAEEAARVREAYRTSFLRSDLSVDGATQTVYAQAIGFGLVDDAEASVLADHLAEAIRRRGYVTTGIHGVQHVLGALARHGHRSLAIDLLLREEMPSWLHMIASGGTTIWEKWDGIRPDGSLATAEMNSFNHCALGAVGEFLFEDLLGLRPGTVAWDDRLEVRPVYTDRLDWVEGSYDSPVGPMGSRWQWHDGVVRHRLSVPPGITATFVVPDGYALDPVTSTGPGGTVELAAGEHELALLPGGAA